MVCLKNLLPNFIKEFDFILKTSDKSVNDRKTCQRQNNFILKVD